MKNDNENNLFKKLVYGDLSEVQALLESGVNLDEHKSEHGDTALFDTLFLGDLKRTKLLLEHNASPNIKNNYGQTILHNLIASNSMEKMEFLLQNATNIDLEIKNNHGFTPLYSSVLDENIKAAELLLKFGADANSKDIYEIPALLCAITNNKLKAAELLLKSGVDVNAQDSHGNNILQSAINIKNIEAAELLLKSGVDINAKDNYGNNILQSAINSYSTENNNLEIIELLLRYKANPNAQDNGGWTLLYCSVFNKIEAAKLLIKYGADVNVGSNNNFTPLDNAMIGQQKELAELFLKSGANITADMGLLHGKILSLLNINVSAEVVANSLLTSNTIPDNIKFNILSSTPHFTKDVHRKVMDNHLKDAMEEWRKNGITEESFHNNKFKDIIKTYKEYKDFAIDYREQAGAPCPAFEDYNTQSTTVFIPPTPSDFAQEVEGLYNTHHKVNSLSYFTFKKFLSKHSNLETIEDDKIILHNVQENTKLGKILNIEYSIIDQQLETLWDSINFFDIIWNDNNSQSILANLFETELSGDIA